MAKYKIPKRYLILIFILILWPALYMAGHNMVVSDYVKKIIIDKVFLYSGQKAEIDSVSMNFVPFFLELKDVSVKGSEEGEWFRSKRIKIYPDLTDLLRKRLNIRRVLLSEADLKMTEGTLALIASAGKGSGGSRRVSVRTVDVRKSRLSYKGKRAFIMAENVNVHALVRVFPEIRFNAGSIAIRSGNFAAHKIHVGGRLVIKTDVVKVESLSLSSGDSLLDIKGMFYPGTMDFSAQAKADLSVSSISRMFKLPVIRKGRILSRGDIKYFDGKLYADTKVSGEFYLESLMSLLEVKEPLRGLTRFKGNLNVKAGKITGHSEAELIKGHLYGLDIDRLTCNVSYKDDKLVFSKGRASLYGGTAEAEVYITLPEVNRFMVKVDAYKVDAKNILKLIGLDIGFSKGVVTGELKSEGEIFSPSGWFGADFRPEQGDVLKRITHAEGTYSSNGSVLELANIRLNTGKSRMDMRGKVYLRKSNLELYGEINTEDISDMILPYYRGVSGSGTSQFSVVGTIDDPLIKGRIDASGVSYRTFGFNSMESSFEYRKDQLKIGRLILLNGNEVHSFEGTILFGKAKHLFYFGKPVFNIRGDLKNFELGKVAKELGVKLPLKGIANARVEIDGSIPNIRAKAEISAMPVSVYGFPIGRVRMNISFFNRIFSFNNMVIAKGDSIISGDLEIDLDGNYRFKTRRVTLQLGQIPAGLHFEKGTLNIEVSGKGSIRHPYLSSRVKVSDVVAGGIAVANGEADIVLKDDMVSVSGKLFGGKTDLRATLNMRNGFQWDLDVKFGRGIYDFIPAYFLREVPEDLMMNMEGELVLSGGRNNYGGYLNMHSLNLTMYGYNISNSSDLIIRLDRREILFKKVSLKTGSASFDVEGSLIPYEKFDLTVYGESSLRIMRKMFKSLKSLNGYGSFVFSIKGEWNRPVVNGGVTVRDASLRIEGFPYRIVDINSYIYIDNNRIVLTSLTGKTGGGAIDVNGYGYLESFKVQRLYLDARLTDATFRIERGFIVNIDSNLVYKGGSGRAGIVGRVDVRKARYTRRVDWRTQLIKPKTIEKPRGTLSPFEKTELNIKIEGSNNVVIDNNIAKTDLNVELLLRGTVNKPVIMGRIETRRGLVFFRNNEFRIINASADFINPEKISPYFDITAETSVKGYDIRIAVEGQMPHLNLSLLSSPPLEETDILALLTVGEFGSKLKGLEAGIGTAEATSFLTGRYQDVIEERLTMLTGLDRFQVEPYVSEKTGTLGPRITVSKRLIGDKLFVTYSSAMGVSEEDVIKLEYQLDKHVSLLGVRDAAGSIGGDIKFKFHFK
ncbi:hypothetical protein BMS3Abin07_00335 [bacterium BMS3Abin07]|nr:hypothetical protein BMS3Abin07_00335 [bacterium BMS3Abin07]GBE31249.1 hypothetical protein BMS3Bbin05_00148 [bacterium BMS3Bbin05]HDO21946.1 translocation/assembly module TamB [Nitrospirota bacterium]HDZ87863.1 translocation/assembly module TamB [Nitrospirota bacterium]